MQIHNNVITAVVATAVIGFAPFWYWDQLLVWTDAHSGFASWVQAIGSILAIVAAFLIANQQTSAQRRDQIKRERAAATVVAAGLLMPLSVLEASIPTMLSAITKRKSEFFPTEKFIHRLNQVVAPSSEELRCFGNALPDAATAYARALHSRAALVQILKLMPTHVIGNIVSNEDAVLLQECGQNCLDECDLARAGLLGLLSVPPGGKHIHWRH